MTSLNETTTTTTTESYSGRKVTSQKQCSDLRDIFIRDDAQIWDKTEISRRKTDILKLDKFSDLGRNHIKYQLDKFCLEFQLRKNIGGKFRDVTSSFGDPQNKFINKNILNILSSVYHWFTDNNPLNCLPVELGLFLKRCNLACINQITSKSTSFVLLESTSFEYHLKIQPSEQK